MKIKNIVLSAMALGGLLIGGFTDLEIADARTTKVVNEVEELEYTVKEDCDYINPNYCGNNSLTNGLESNQTTLFYMYSNEEGHYLLDPLAEYENVIFVGHDDFLITKEQAHHGNRFIGTFEDDTLWELVGLEEVKYY